MSNTTTEWEFWIDVGGTFTDCLGRSPDGRQHRHKTLSSGVVKGNVVDGTRRSIVDRIRRSDPPNFWIGWTIRLLANNGTVIAESVVSQFDRSSGTLELATPLLVPPSTGQAYELDAGLDAPLVAVRYLTKVPPPHPLPPSRVRLGTTRGTNALLTRRGARTAWITNKGFADLLEIGYQDRAELFRLNFQKPERLYERVVEVSSRFAANGDELSAIDLEQVESQLRVLRAQGIESLAIGLMHAYAYPKHEQQIAAVANKLGFSHVSVSHQVAPVMRLVTRGDTTVVDAYLNPVLQSYLQRIESELGPNSTLRLMNSAGGLEQASHFTAKDSILSGPAGGVVGFANVAKASGHSRAIGFDMGGTSTDVARYDGRFEYEYETSKAGVRVAAPMLSIETVAAGGGSICDFDGVKLSVGPASAGAFPGPACYGNGGPLTVTDINLFLGRLPVDALPFELDMQAVTQRLSTLQKRIKDDIGVPYRLPELAAGFLSIANQNMAQAIRTISVAKGYDPRDYVMVAFGGAAPQHACGVARELHIRQVIDHPDGSILSAVGIGLADVTRHRQQAIYRPLASFLKTQVETFEKLRTSAINDLLQEGIPSDRIKCRSSLQLRYQGTDWPLAIETPDDGDYERAFQARHQQQYGYIHTDRRIEVVAAHMTATGHGDWSLPTSEQVAGHSRIHQHTIDLFHNNQVIKAALHHRSDLAPGDRIAGPAVIVQSTSTTVIDPGWEGEMMEQGELLLTDHHADVKMNQTLDYDPIAVEIFHSHLEAIATQMGVTLRNTSSSVNVKERLDFSCAIFTQTGNLVVNAPHIPVHLGAMGETVRHVIDEHRDLRPGDVVITNDPFHGGSHLPDITVITPVFSDAGDTIRFFVASRAHHAEIGGTTPGSMPPFSQSLAEEGVLVRSFKLIAGGTSQLQRLREILTSAPYPSRDVDSNLADVQAQIAANRQGEIDLRRLEERYEWKVLDAYMGHIQHAAEVKMRRALANLDDGRYEFVDQLDEGAQIRVAIDIVADQARIDFSGTADVLPNNLNANRAIVTAAVMYSLRCLIDEPIPLNQGVLAPVELVVPAGMLNPPHHEDPTCCAAVAGGNVETSQRIVDVLLGAFGAAAASQGTMNNLLFGNDHFGYYETICGGAGATASAPGCSAVQTHMTNTRLTDPEVLEFQHPVRVKSFQIRHGSGGMGKFVGGDGVIRSLEFLAPLRVSIISQRRGPTPPYGLCGGQPADCGENRLVRADQSVQILANRVQIDVDPGDVLIVETPGGGGYGEIEDASPSEASSKS